jgi:hypothetical protein
MTDREGSGDRSMSDKYTELWEISVLKITDPESVSYVELGTVRMKSIDQNFKSDSKSENNRCISVKCIVDYLVPCLY